MEAQIKLECNQRQQIRTEGPVKRREFPLKNVVSLKELQKSIDNGKCKVSDITGKLNSEVEGINNKDLLNVHLKHDEEDFYVFCGCDECLKYREIILRLMSDHFSMRSMWEILRKIITKFYKPIIESASTNALDLYEIWVEDNKYSWLINGVLDRTKLQHLEFISELSLTENVILVLFSALFVAEDGHQLLELMSYQVECFAKAYSAGLSDKIASIDKGQCTAESVINYVLNGYEKMCKVAEEMSRYLFAFEINHLKQFDLDWITLNKRMFQRYILPDFVAAMPKCIIMLKDEVPSQLYTELVRKCIKFDDDMIEVNKKWKDIWTALNEYHISPRDQARRNRLKSVHKIFEVIRQDISVPYVQFVDIPNWETYEDKQVVWQNMVAYIKRRWPTIDEFRLNANTSAELCKNCHNNLREFHKDDCSCVTCSIAGAPAVSKITKEATKGGVCIKCTFAEKIVKDSANYIANKLPKITANKNVAGFDSEEKTSLENVEILHENDKTEENLPLEKVEILQENDKPEEKVNLEKIEMLHENEKLKNKITTTNSICESSECSNKKTTEEYGKYHLSWAVFKHLKDRKKYPYKNIDEKYFCSNCTRTSCTLAKKFINREIAFCLAHHLMKNYQPFSVTLDKLVETVPCIVMYNHKALSILHDPTNDDLILRTLWTFITSSVASYFADMDADSSKPQISQLKLTSNDIELPLQHLEEKAKSKKFIDFFGKTLGILQSDEQNFSPSLTPKSLKETILKQIHAKSSMDNNKKKFLENPKKLYEDPPVRLEMELIKPRELVEPSKPKPICCSDQHCKENHMNRTCMHDKENNSRMNETRDRLRKKLSQLTSAKKNVKTINKTSGKSPLDLIKVLNRNPPSLSSLSKEMAKIQNKPNISKEIADKNIVAKGNTEKEDKPKSIIKPAIVKESRGTNTVIPNVVNQNLDDWVKDTLSFIEGDGEPKKIKNVTNNKKAAKKAKQKLKREEHKRIEELQDLRSQFHDLYFKEFLSKNELKTQKAAKKKDKKRIGELESNIKKLSKAKSKIETNILEFIATIKSTNSEFKFPYLPTKEQQQEVLKRNTLTVEPSSTVSNGMNNISNNKSQNETSARIYYPTEPQFVPPNEFRSPPGHTVQVTYPPQTSSNEVADPAKGIVTIRRVNLPNVPEPQVTVTAKGSSPDKDKLLYTFINGQLVPATSLDAQTLNVLQPAAIYPTDGKSGNQLSKNDQRQQEQQQQQQRRQQSLRGNVQKNSALIEQSSTKTKTQLKKEKKRAKKLALEMEKKMEDLKPIKPQTSNDKRNKIIVDNSMDRVIDKSKKSANKNQNKVVSQSKCSSSDSGINSREHSVSNGKSRNVKPSNCSQNNSQSVKVKRNDKLADESDGILVQEKKEIKQKRVIDNGQFDNNQFKMLHLDEFSSESEESVITESITKSIKSIQLTVNKNGSNSINKQNKVEKNKNNLKKDTNQKEAKNINQIKAITEGNSTANRVILEENKKQKKKANKKQMNKINPEINRTCPTSINKATIQAGNMTRSLRHSMQKLNINAGDNTMEMGRECVDNSTSMSNLNVSIMEQLNRGVQVEDLTLPPGITLTKVDPSRAEALRAKTESIGKLSQPMQQQSQSNSIVQPIISPALLPHLGRFGSDQNGVIMVDAMGNKTASEINNQQNDGKKTKKNKRKTKKKKVENSPDDSLNRQKSGESKMITLRNPMFHGQSMRVLSMPNNVPIAPLPMDQPAAIIKNENGMFTIRNPALHQAFSAGAQNNYRNFNQNFYVPTENCRNFSYFSDNISNTNQYSNGAASTKCLSAIGSEMKTAQQQKKTGNQWSQSQNNNCSTQSKCGYMGDQSHFTTIQQKYQQSSYCNTFDVFPQNASGNLFDTNCDSTHNCDETPPPSRAGYNHYLDDIPNQSNQNNKYDDMSFFRNLIPGQRLNSEVTIHNINESKFSPNSTSPHNVEITPISRPTSRSNNFSPEQHHQDGLQNKTYSNNLGEYGDNLFVPNQMLNLNDLESEDREVETFKRFSYGFDPPKEKPKANINVNDLLGSKKSINPTTTTSPYIDESLENFVRNMNSLKISSENAMNGNSQDTNDRNNWW